MAKIKEGVQLEKHSRTNKRDYNKHQNDKHQNFDHITFDNFRQFVDDDFDKKYESHLKYGFKMSDVEYARYLNFCKEHKDCLRREDGSHTFGTIGGGISVSFMGTGLGYLINCKCHTCNVDVNITDIDSW